MRKKHKLIFAVLVFVSFTIYSDTTHVLFIGNSYTEFNNLPLLFTQLSAAGGRTVYTEMSAPGGYTLEGHTQLQESLDKIRSRQWQYVILQEQSQYPTIDYYRYNSMYPSARSLDSLISITGSNTMFYMTWGRKYGGEQCINGHCSPVFRDYFHMQDSLESAYNTIASQLNAQLSPVGLAWKRARMLDTAIELWDMDYSHPSLKGSYLAACVFYAKIFGVSPVGLNFYAGLLPAEALWLQQVAAGEVIGIANSNITIPESFFIEQNYPNPFNPATKINFGIPESGFVQLTIYDNKGSEILNPVNSFLNAGNYSALIDLTGYSSGVYFYVISFNGAYKSKKMLLIK